jgi:transcriptional regulator with XRE-family HTH domain
MQSAAHARSVDAIAARLRATQEALGLNQRELCALAGIATNTYNQWVNAKGRPDLDEAFKLCDTLRLTLDWIYRGDPSALPHSLALKLATPLEPTPAATPGPDAKPARRAKGGRR